MTCGLLGNNNQITSDPCCHPAPASLDYEGAEFGLALSAFPQGYTSSLVTSCHLPGGCP